MTWYAWECDTDKTEEGDDCGEDDNGGDENEDDDDKDGEEVNKGTKVLQWPDTIENVILIKQMMMIVVKTMMVVKKLTTAHARWFSDLIRLRMCYW